ncbi:uncharacterized protein [Halyomorpha halys]|uniref:uncharacterized protein isoform X1 n=1 Tax=Halyomorpha halys TaxID=286706 RepID=UPI0006D4E647|nr:Odorant receptor 90 [Halyomorpha halys]
MDPPRFIHHYRPLIGWLRKCGLPNPWAETPSTPRRLLLFCYDSFLVIMVSYMISVYIYSIASISISFADLCSLGTSGCCFMCSLFITLYMALFRKRIKMITEGMDSIAEVIFQNELGGAGLLQEMYQKNAKLMAILTSNSISISFLAPCTYCWSVPFVAWLSGTYRDELPLPLDTSYNYRLPVIYELMVMLISCSIGISTSKKSAVDCFFISLFNIQIDFLKYLSVSKRYLQEEFNSGKDIYIRKKLIMWIKLHQDINMNIQQLLTVFSPVIIVYNLTMVIIVVCGAFVQIKSDSNNLIQSLSIGAYVAIAGLYYYLMAHTAEELTTQAEKLAFSAYDLQWYSLKKADIDMLRMVILRANVPIQVTAYCAPRFILKRETFANFVVTSISAFVTFCQIKDRYR